MKVSAICSLVCDGHPPDTRLTRSNDDHVGDFTWHLSINVGANSLDVYGATAEAIAADLEALAADVRRRAREIVAAQLLETSVLDDEPQELPR